MNPEISNDGLTHTWKARILPGAPLIMPARQITLPLSVPGEEDAMARGAVWLEVRPERGGIFVAQCALGFAGQGVATGLWPTPDPDVLLAIAGGYAYRIPTSAPEGATLLPLRPVVQVRSATEPPAVVLVGFHTIYVLISDEGWESPRLSWEGVTVDSIDDHVVHGTGWHMRTDRELPFALDLRTRQLTGGGFVP